MSRSIATVHIEGHVTRGDLAVTGKTTASPAATTAHRAAA